MSLSAALQAVSLEVPDLQRAERVAAAAAFAAWRVLVDGHLSRHEERTLRRVFQRDFDEREIDLIVRLLETRGESLAALPYSAWMEVLGPWLLPEEYAAARRAGTRSGQYAGDLTATLAVRWPLPIDEGGRTRWAPQELRWGGEALHVGGPHGIHSMVVPWGDVQSIEPVDPWPELLVEWKSYGGAVANARIAPKGDREAFADRVSDLLEAARERVPAASDRVRIGWLATPDVRLEDAAGWPGEEPESHASYRTAPRKPEEVLAVRERPTGLRVLLAWLASSPDRPFSDDVVEARLTATHLYVQRRRGGVKRVSRGALRTRRGDLDAVYVFGRRTEILLTGRAGCPVCRALDAQLMKG